MSTSSETLRPGIAWNATRAASVLMVVILAVIALVFWPSFEAPDASPPTTRQASVAGAPHLPVVVNGGPCAQCLP